MAKNDPVERLLPVSQIGGTTVEHYCSYINQWVAEEKAKIPGSEVTGRFLHRGPAPEYKRYLGIQLTVLEREDGEKD